MSHSKVNRFVIIGAGVAGIRAAEVLREQGPDASITIISAERNPFYFRPRLADFAAGYLSEKEIASRTPQFFSEKGIDLILGTCVRHIDTTNSHVSTGDSMIPYDKLLIATGSVPAPVPNVPEENEGVIKLKTLEDAQRLRSAIKFAKSAVVVGDGLFALELARGLKDGGLEVECLLESEGFWPDLLDHTASRMITDVVSSAGIKISPLETIRSVKEEGGRITGVITSKNREIACSIVGLGSRLRPDLSAVSGSCIKTDIGILVNNMLQTNVPGIYAAGDVAQRKGLIRSTHRVDHGWKRAWEQGAVAGMNMLGFEHYYEEIPAIHSTVFGLNMLALGEIAEAGEGLQSITSKFSDYHFYSRLVFEGVELIGAIFIGDISPGGEIGTLVRQRARIQDFPLDLLRTLFDPSYRITAPKRIFCPVCRREVAILATVRAERLTSCSNCGAELRVQRERLKGLQNLESKMR